MGFFTIGMDSLTAMEFRDRLESSLGMSLPSTLALDYSSVETLAPYLLSKIPDLEVAPEVSVDADDAAISPTLLMLESLSDTEVEERLLRKLETLNLETL
jgi:hypothetical protein